MMNWSFIRQVGFMKWMVRYSRRQFHKRILRRDSRLRLPTGAWITLPAASASATEVYVTKANIDWGSEALFVRFADASRDFLDIGSHIGYYATYLSPCVRKVYAFEPDPRNIPALRRNALESGNIEVVETAVSSFDGSASFFGGRGSAVGSLEQTGGPATQVPVTAIDTFIAEHPGLDICLIKTDIEGHDLQALRGMQSTISRYQPLILSECSHSRELFDLCQQWRYSIFAFWCDQETLKTQFTEILPGDAGKWIKMLFLVPRRLTKQFEDQTRTAQTV